MRVDSPNWRSEKVSSLKTTHFPRPNGKSINELLSYHSYFLSRSVTLT